LGRTGRPESSGNEWITSHHTSVQTDDHDNEFSDLDDDFIIREDWWSSKKRNVTLEYLKTIANNNDKALQLLLWDVGFDYYIILISLRPLDL
jgi:hypothetical protein